MIPPKEELSKYMTERILTHEGDIHISLGAPRHLTRFEIELLAASDRALAEKIRDEVSPAVDVTSSKQKSSDPKTEAE